MIADTRRQAFYEDVNRLAQIEADILNADTSKLFGAIHHRFPDSMLAYYFDRGFTPEEAIEEIDAAKGP